MKGTLYSADFVKNSLNEFKLLELNTDTDFPSASLVHFDWNPFISELHSASIDTVHVIYKDFQKHTVQNFSESLANSEHTFNWETTVENPETIYPTDIQDSSTTFVLRLAYNEAAILDSEYCKNGIPLYKLFTNEDFGGNIVPHYVSSSNDDYVNDSLEKQINNQNIPDYAVKSGIVTSGVHLDFYKFSSSSLTPEQQFDEMIQSTYTDGDIISTYYDTTEGGQYVSSYRSCNILYGSSLDSIIIGAYKIPAWFEIPTQIETDPSSSINKVSNKHRYEFASNWPKEYWKNQGGVHSESELQPITGSIEKAKDTVVGKLYKSIDIAGLPDVDSYETITAWSVDGDTLPVGTSITSSQLISKQSSSVAYGVLSEISMSDDTSLYLGSSLPLLVYDVNADKIRFEYVNNLETGSYKLFDASGSKVNIVENNLVVFDGEEYTYELNMESDDTYLINNSGVFLIAHNPYYTPGVTCFLAGTEIQTVTGAKPIEEILVGDSVLCWDFENSKFEVSDVTEIDHRHTVADHIDGCMYLGYNQPGVFKIFVDMGAPEGPNDLGVRFTPEHPFLTKDGWKSLAPLVNQEPWATEQDEVKFLKEGDFVMYNGIDGPSWLEIKSIEFEPTNGEEKVYNFTVNNYHNYLAGNVVVHNK